MTLSTFNQPSHIDTLDLFPQEEVDIPDTATLNRANLGTFQDSLRSPVHRWFTYPAGFSYKAVEEAFNAYGIRPGMTVYDPFAGTATTNIVAKQRGLRSFGIEAHPFVQFVARTKLFWEYDFGQLRANIDALLENVATGMKTSDAAPIDTDFPELVHKCYSREKLARLHVCRQAVLAQSDPAFRNFAKLAVTNLLRAVSDVAAGWPYIAPKKAKTGATTAINLNITAKLHDQLYMMYEDLRSIRTTACPGGEATLIAGDSRVRHEEIADESVQLAFTSPPYLNNFDYADRTRLETYFWGDAKTWGDITEKVRTKLIMSATTQINRGDYHKTDFLSSEFLSLVPNIIEDLATKVVTLSKLRLIKGGKKSYDIMVSGYFNDMLLVMQETYRVLSPGSKFVMILGDSAPYGVYIPTDTYLGEIGRAVGFANYDIEELRIRGGKWKDNPQRHDVMLKECILTLHKA